MAARPYVQKLLDAGTPRALIAILFLMSYMSDFDKTLGDLDVLEIFAGIGAIHDAAQQRGYRARKLDNAYSETNDISKPWGFLLALLYIRRLRVGGLCVMAPVCSSFSFLCSSVTGRCVMLPEGLQASPVVRMGNLLGTRSVLFIYLARAMGLTYLLEQPQHHTTGGLASIRLFKEMCETAPVYRCSLVMAAFGAETRKPTWLYSNHLCFKVISRRCLLWQQQQSKAVSKAKKKVKKAIVKRSVNAAGKTTVTGIPSMVRATQEYSPEFAEAVIHTWAERCDDEQREECAACRTLEQHGLPSMFEKGEADYDEQANIALLMSAPIDWMEQAELLAVVRWMKASGRLQLPAAWPADFP